MKNLLSKIKHFFFYPKVKEFPYWDGLKGKSDEELIKEFESVSPDIESSIDSNKLRQRCFVMAMRWYIQAKTNSVDKIEEKK